MIADSPKFYWENTAGFAFSPEILIFSETAMPA
jgi:hypothetical protein